MLTVDVTSGYKYELYVVQTVAENGGLCFFVTSEIFDDLVDLPEFTRDADVLRTMGLALATLDAVVGLTITRHYTIQGDQVLTTMFAILRIAHTHRQ